MRVVRWLPERLQFLFQPETFWSRILPSLFQPDFFTEEPFGYLAVR